MDVTSCFLGDRLWNLDGQAHTHYKSLASFVTTAYVPIFKKLLILYSIDNWLAALQFTINAAEFFKYLIETQYLGN